MERLSLRAINRATLARQLLIERDTRPAESAIEHLVGMQAQAPFPPYTGLWTRLADFRPDELADALLSTGGSCGSCSCAAPCTWSRPPTRASCARSSR